MERLLPPCETIPQPVLVVAVKTPIVAAIPESHRRAIQSEEFWSAAASA
jgi:hypothetical protein